MNYDFFFKSMLALYASFSSNFQIYYSIQTKLFKGNSEDKWVKIVKLNELIELKKKYIIIARVGNLRRRTVYTLPERGFWRPARNRFLAFLALNSPETE